MAEQPNISQILAALGEFFWNLVRSHGLRSTHFSIP